MMRNASATKRSLCFLALSVACMLSNRRAAAAPQPMSSGMMYRENGYDGSIKNSVDRYEAMERKKERIFKEIRKMSEEQEIASFVNAQLKNKQDQQAQMFSEEDPETPPVVPVVYRDEEPPAEKRNFVALCHFKICNMGRKRQQRSAS
ncbi:uncharacterized protein LOC111643926 [Copidosoma floridanum]|nr:uncharacterized protein LOC106639832 isoform X2 [Copidosoma floridanum]XP_023248033.1 uncharacterized protein LOC111643926 [Copidosoma floridanum]